MWEPDTPGRGKGQLGSDGRRAASWGRAEDVRQPRLGCFASPNTNDCVPNRPLARLKGKPGFGVWG